VLAGDEDLDLHPPLDRGTDLVQRCIIGGEVRRGDAQASLGTCEQQPEGRSGQTEAALVIVAEHLHRVAVRSRHAHDRLELAQRVPRAARGTTASIVARPSVVLVGTPTSLYVRTKYPVSVFVRLARGQTIVSVQPTIVAWNGAMWVDHGTAG